MCLRAYVRCVSVANEYIGGVRTVGSGLQSFFFLVCVDFLFRQLDVLLTGFVVDGIPYAYINMCLRAYIWCVFVTNEYIMQVCAVGSGLQSFVCLCVLIFYLDS